MADMIEALRTFARMCERPSFTAVAAEMHASHTTIARRIDFLEAHFGVQLFRRSTRRLEPTQEAHDLLHHAHAVIDGLDEAEAALGRRRRMPAGTVRVGVTTALGFHYVERLGELLDAYPELRVEFVVTDWQRSLIAEGLDLALRVGEVEEETLVIRRLGPIGRVLVASGAYLAAHGHPARLDDLSAHQCITYGYGADPAAWEVDGRMLTVGGRFRADSSEAVHRAVSAGLGIGLLPAIRVAGEVASGHLIRLFADRPIPPLPLSVVHPANRNLPARVRVVLDFIARNFPDRSST